MKHFQILVMVVKQHGSLGREKSDVRNLLFSKPQICVPQPITFCHFPGCHTDRE